MNTMRSIPDMVAELQKLSDYYDDNKQRGELLRDAANYIEGATDSLREHMKMLTEMRVRLEEVRPLMEEAAKQLEEYVNFRGYDNSNPDEKCFYDLDMKLPRSIRAMLRWWKS